MPDTWERRAGPGGLLQPSAMKLAASWSDRFENACGRMHKKKLPKAVQLPIQEYCHELWSIRSGLNVGDLFKDVPPQMRTNLTNYLYGARAHPCPQVWQCGRVFDAIMRCTHTATHYLTH